jgi:hypothetical protein
LSLKFKVQWLWQQSFHQYEYHNLLIHGFFSKSFGLVYHQRNVTTIHQQSYGKVKYLKLNIWMPQVKSSFVHGSQYYQDIFHIANNQLFLDTRDVLLDKDYNTRLGIMKIRHLHYFQKNILVQGVDPGV